MAIVRKEWEDRYDEIKNMPDVPTNEQKKAEWEGKEMQFRARLAEIKDTTSPEYKAIMAERKQAKKEFESEQTAYYSVQTYLKANGTNFDAVKKNFRQIDKTRENRDIYQSLLDELLAAKEANSQIEAKREQIQAEIKKLDEELEDLRQQEKDALNAIENFAKTPEQKASAQSWLEEVRGKIKINQNGFHEKHKELKEELSKPLIEVPENDIKELQEKIDRCNKTCELLLQGKTIGEVYNELGKEPEVAEKPEPKVTQTPSTETPSTEIPVPEAETPNTETPVPEAETPSTEIPVPEAETPNTETPSTEIPVTEAETPSEETPVTEEEIGATINKIVIQIGKNGQSITIVERDGEEPRKGEPLDLSESDEKLQTSAETAPEADKWVGREMWRSVEEGVLSKEEMTEQYQIYLNIMRGKNVEENIKKLKINLQYDLTGLKGLDSKTKREIRQNAKDAKKLGIAEVETYFTKAQKWVKDKLERFKTWGKDKLLKGKEPERISAPDDTQISDTAENISYEDRLLADLDSKGAFNQAWKPKKPGELSHEEKKIQQEIAKTVAEAMEEKKATVDQKMSDDINKLIEADGVEQDQ